MTALFSCLPANSRLRAASRPYQFMVMNNIKGSTTKLTSDKIMKVFGDSRNIARWYNGGVRNLEIDARLLLHFQRSAARPYLMTEPLGQSMLPHADAVAAVLKYNDEDPYDRQSALPDSMYVSSIVKKMLDGMQADVKAFIFGPRSYKIILEIRYK